MYIYDTDDLLSRRELLRVSLHALVEVHKEGLRGKDIIYAVLNGRVIERYPDRNRVLIAGPTVKYDLPLHVVCDYDDRDEIVVVTAYIPSRSGWAAGMVRMQPKQDQAPS